MSAQNHEAKRAQQIGDGQSSPRVGAGPAHGPVKEPVTETAREGSSNIARPSRVIFSAPLSPLTHNVFARAPARSWLATGECGRICFLANTDEPDWRYAVLQVVHELVEAALHRQHNVTQTRIDADDFDALALDRAAPSRAHSIAIGIETQLALALGVSFTDYSRAVRGIHSDPLYAALRQHP